MMRAVKLVLVALAMVVGVPWAASAQATLVKDIRAASDPSYSGSPREFVTISGVTFFVQTTPREGTELWKTNGTQAGTTLVKDIASGVTDGPFAEAKEVVGGYMVVAAESSDAAVEIARECPGVVRPGSIVEIREIVSP